MSTGYFGKVLWVDLTKENFEEQNLEDNIIRQYFGGYGLGCRLIYEFMDPKIDALHENSILSFFPGLLTGTPAPLSGRYMVAGKSPLTGTWGDANCGGTFGPEIKKCGYDGILIKGIAETPKYIAIIDGKKEILDASDSWGLNIIEAEESAKKKHGNLIKVASIGLAGEKLSHISGIANDKGRIAARSGLGAIMGSKKLKMLVLKGNQKIKINNRELFLELVKEYNAMGKKKEPGKLIKSIIKRSPNLAKLMRRFKIKFSGPPGMVRHVYKTFGTSMGNTISAETGDSPVKNWKGIGMYDFPFSVSQNLSTLEINKYKIRDYGCFSCPIQCGAILKVPQLNLEETHIPEYETCCSFGALLLNNDLMSIFEINELCNRAAIDTISTGATVAFAIECFEKGILTKNDTNGLELSWGDSRGIIDLVKKIIKREGIGDILADGCDLAAKRIGKGSEQYTMTSMGSEIAMHNPRVFPSLAFTYAFDPTPGRHTAASIDMLDIGKVDKFQEGFKLPKGREKDNKKWAKGQKRVTCLHQSLSCVGLCMFSTLFGPYPFLDLINSFTGWNLSLKDCLDVGLRIQTLRHTFNLREGINIANNELPGRVIGNPPDNKGPTKDISIDYKIYFEDYCKEMGWNPKNGYPLEQTLKNLNLEFVIKDLY
jgi:aldehyde:ferredoxin oxidoreductase